MSRAELIAEAFELQRMGKLCNVPECGKIPSKRVSLIEENRINSARRTIATIHLCNEHYSDKLASFLAEINKIRDPGTEIVKMAYDVGHVTY
jgi:hypothetical protein